MPIFITCFSASSVSTIADLSAAAPNLFVSSGPSAGGATAAFSMPGVGQPDFIATSYFGPPREPGLTAGFSF